jgi:hypothetical protein
MNHSDWTNRAILLANIQGILITGRKYTATVHHHETHVNGLAKLMGPGEETENKL